jgi:hypothetical protein
MTVENTTTEAIASEVIELAPSYKIPISLVLIAIPLFLLNKVTAVLILILGAFLMFQAKNIRIQFTPTALNVCNSSKIIRSFPYEEWINWRIFWQPVPILFYFKEVNSIHFLPIIFDPKTLVNCLEKYCLKS